MAPTLLLAMADISDTAASPHYQMARENTQSADDKVMDEKLANETGVEALDGELLVSRNEPFCDRCGRQMKTSP